jgi:DNA-directed RNA polymerase subunit M/transcription elongation factor TFIIS
MHNGESRSRPSRERLLSLKQPMAIRVQCPVCTKTLHAPENAAGKGCACPSCQSIVPIPLTNDEQSAPDYFDEPLPLVLAVPPPLPIETGRVTACPTCGKLLTITPELEGSFVTCPFCEREFRAGGHALERPRKIRKRRRFRFECPYCGSHEEPIDTSRVSSAGWVLFVLLFPLFCWIGLLIRERETRCYDCRRRLYF